MSREYQPSYIRVMWMFLRNSLVRDMSFRSNFWLECIASTSWVVMNIGFYVLVFSHVRSIGAETGWGKWEFFVFLATTMFVNSLIQAFFMPNAEEFSEMIRTGGLDFALLKPIDTQFLISLRRVSWSALANFLVAIVLISLSLWKLTTRVENPLQLAPSMFLLYPFFVLCGVAIMYSLMLMLAATSVWLGRNQTLYNFWFYITNFSRYPMEIYGGPYGSPLRWFFTFIVPVLIVVNVPARIMARPLAAENPRAWMLTVFAVIATLISLLASRWLFYRALRSYRSASS